jgi:pimeloyl-ACP methyl ester carboxylesterase
MMADSLLHIVKSNDATPIACKVSGDGPPLILVHGSASVGDRWAAVTPLLTQHFTVYAMDRRGRGASGDSKDYSIEREFEDIACVLASIDGPVNLLGHSFGGVCSMEAALRVSNLRRLIVYEPSTPTPGVQHYPTGFVDRLQTLLDQGQQEDVLLTFMREIVRMPPLVIDQVKQQEAWPGRVAAAHSLPREFRDLESYRPDPSRFVSLDIPTLLLLGGDSPARYRTAIELMSTLIRGSRIEVLSGQQHNAMDTAPELFAETMINFLK